LAPHAPISQYHNNQTGEDNADAHLKRHGPPSVAVVVAVTNGRLDFGTWKPISYGEFDDRRRKRVLGKIIGETCLSTGLYRPNKLKKAGGERLEAASAAI
jgi:thiamine phosphate synthase YjbQ (UPF0047 family)